MLLVYTHKVTSRLKYIFEQMCTGILGIPVRFTDTVENFVSHDSLKMSYTKKPLGNEMFMRSTSLLFEQGISSMPITVYNWEHTKCFFDTSPESCLPYDIFAASFYLLSRYEEYFIYAKDAYGGYRMENSLAFREGFLKQPVVDIWAYKFKAVLEEHYPDYTFPKRTYHTQPIIDVPSAYFYKHKGSIRTCSAIVKDIFKFNIAQIYKRLAVLFSLEKDPYDTFSYIINKQKQFHLKFIVFFLVGEYSSYDKAVSIKNSKLQALIKHIGDYCNIGLRVSYSAIQKDDTVLKQEKHTLEQVIHTPVLASRNSFSKLNLPHTYRKLIDLEVKDDYSMGYIDNIGYRAGTCTPFFFYDLDYDIKTPLRIHPYQFTDTAVRFKTSQKDKKRALNSCITQTQKVNGKFIGVFHNYVLGNQSQWKGYKELFNIILDSENNAV